MHTGSYTHCDMSDARCLLLPRNGTCAKQTVCMALELSRLVYDMDIAPCLDAGWQDISFVVDDLLQTGLHGGDAKARKVCLQAAARARGRLEKRDPLSQLRGFRRQKEALDTCKAMIMAKDLDETRTMIVISFAGTTRRLYEWLGNLRLEEEDGFHAGFLRLTQQFEEKASQVLFPLTAQKMGFSRLSLTDVLQHLRLGSERFEIFVTGHSQGAALMQVYIHRLIASGVGRERLGGIGFASPAVVYDRALGWATDYPIRHFINADDLVARVGGRMHIGLCSVLPVSVAYRRACYGPKADEDAMQALLRQLHSLRGTQDALLFAIALMDELGALDESDSEEIMRTVARTFMPDALAQRFKGYARRIAHALARRLEAKCIAVTGCVDAEKRASLRVQINDLFLQYGAQKVMEMLSEVMLRPHALADKDNLRAYQLLTKEYTRELATTLWLESEMPVWDMQFSGARDGRRRRAYHRLRPLQSERENRKK